LKKEEMGVVIEIAGNLAKVRSSRDAGCECHGDIEMVLMVQNPLSAKPGQRVVFEMPEANVAQVSLIIFIVPLVLTTIGTVLGWLLASNLGQAVITCQIIGGIVGFVLALLAIKKYDSVLRNSEKMQPVITKIVS
jgi:sigma-E factor negative regulatory protein RseC